ncbi:MAG: hypothetical protein WKF73_03430 [Nocardioidaceae bacterium]
MSDEAADLLSRLVTGDMIEKRRLYTDAELATIVYRRTGVITGISVPRGGEGRHARPAHPARTGSAG